MGIVMDPEVEHFNKSLRDCRLPAGFELLTPHPRQFWIEEQMRWGFCLAWKKTFYYVARHEAGIPDEVQMRWALEDFRRELIQEGAILQEMKEFLPNPQTTRLRKISTPVFLRLTTVEL